MKLKDAEKRLKQEPSNLGLRVQVAGLMREAGRSLEAVELYRSVALAYRDQGRTQQAIAVCKSILEIAPEDSACQGLLSMLQQRASQSQLRPQNPARPSASELARPQTPTAQPTPVPVRPTVPERPQSQPTAVMRGSPMPPAPEVPSLRPQTAPPVASRTVTNRPISRPQPTQPPPSAPATPRDRPPTKPQPIVPKPATSAHVVPRPASGSGPPRPPPQPEQRPSDPTRRSSFDQTPLPAPVPYHMTDPTSRPNKISSGDIDIPMDDDTRPDQAHSGLVSAARKISGMIGTGRDSRAPEEIDVSAELDTRQRRRIANDELNKIQGAPPTSPIDPLDALDLDDLETPAPPPDPEDLIATDKQRPITPLPRGSEETLTPPPTRRSTPALPQIGRTPSKPHVVTIPAKTPSRPPVISIPPKNTSPSRPPGGLPTIGAPVGKLKPKDEPLPRPGLAKNPGDRTSDEELTRPRDRGAPDDEDD